MNGFGPCQPFDWGLDIHLVIVVEASVLPVPVLVVLLSLAGVAVDDPSVLVDVLVGFASLLMA